MSLHIPPYQPLPPPGKATDIFKVSIADLHPTQMCVGLAEVRSRQVDFSRDSREQRLRYLKGKPVPIVRNASGRLWMVDRHHRLRGLIELDPEAEAYGYLVLELNCDDRATALEELHRRGWLYLDDGRGLGPGRGRHCHGGRHLQPDGRCRERHPDLVGRLQPDR